MINVTKTFLPSFEEYASILKRAWDKGWITNNGELVLELEQSLRDCLDVKNLQFTCNGTIVLQMALKALDITKEVITTPFSYVATTNAILWEGCTPVFVDIDPATFCIDPNKIEAAITENTQAILATHVYGLPCNIEKIASIAANHNLKIIYDGAHAFGCSYKRKSLLSYGDVATCSFHATKLFHTVEGGCIICNDDETANKLMLFRQFGHIYDDYFSVGINAKNSEFHAAMGLAVLPKVSELIEMRKGVFNAYCDHLDGCGIQLINNHIPDFEWNYSYFPALFQDEDTLLRIKAGLSGKGYNTRRYFYPSLNQLPFINEQRCIVSENVSKRVLCLPLFPDLCLDDVKTISSIIKYLV
jgi:dTDP-4-amino-4,6-dideoxygalactose transaminase